MGIATWILKILRKIRPRLNDNKIENQIARPPILGMSPV